MPIFNYSVLIGVEHKIDLSVNAEMMIFIVKSETPNTYAQHLSEEKEFWYKEGLLVTIFDNKNIFAEGLDAESFEGTALKPHISNIGEIKNFAPDIDFGISQEIFSKSFKFKNKQDYSDFAATQKPKVLHDIQAYSDPDRYFMWVDE